MNNEIKDSVLDCNSMCEHRKDCCHPWCACGINERGEVSKEPIVINVLKHEHYTPLDRYNDLIAKRNRKVRQGIPLSYGK